MRTRRARSVRRPASYITDMIHRVPADHRLSCATFQPSAARTASIRAFSIRPSAPTGAQATPQRAAFPCLICAVRSRVESAAPDRSPRTAIHSARRPEYTARRRPAARWRAIRGAYREAYMSLIEYCLRSLVMMEYYKSTGKYVPRMMGRFPCACAVAALGARVCDS